MQRIIRLLKRPSSKDDYIPQVDGLRFVAIMLVFSFHLSEFLIKKNDYSIQNHWLTPVSSNGTLGVLLFFTLSGFIIFLPFSKKAYSSDEYPSLKKYYLRRIKRLEPPYIINLLFMFFVKCFYLNLSFIDLFQSLFFSVLYLHGLVYEVPSLINGVAWSLEIEFQFYMLAPAIAVIFFIKSSIVRLSSIIIIFFLVIVLPSFVPFEWVKCFSIVHYLNCFIVGFIIAELYSSGLIRSWKENYFWDIVGVFSFIGLFKYCGKGVEIQFIFSLCLILLFISSFKGIILSRILSWSPIYIIGGMCYTLYLYHFSFISLFGNPVLSMLDYYRIFQMEWRLLILFLIVTPITIMGCSILYLLFEKPFMNRKEIEVKK